MNKQWQRSLFRIALWICTEIVLNLLNLDTLSDYSEFLFEKHFAVTSPRIVLYQNLRVASTIPPNFIYQNPSALSFSISLF